MQGEQGNIAPLFQLSLEFSPSAPNEERIPQVPAAKPGADQE